MRVFVSWVMVFLLASPLFAQQACYTEEYRRASISRDPGLAYRLQSIEDLVQRQLTHQQSNLAARGEESPAIIKIPVVVHILYNQSSQNIPDERVYSQIAALNENFRRLNADTVNTPAAFKSVAADCQIEFQLAISDPMRRNTTGIIRKYTPVTVWTADDNMKFTAQAGDDAWDADQYLNIWVCNLRLLSGYSSSPGEAKQKDGIVLSFGVFGKNAGTGHEQGKTTVHEVGHWLGLKHIWGDSYCGDDGIDDTPQQGNFTSGCPTGFRSSCSNGPSGDMYMNYMDLTSDNCTNLFTLGQKQRMLSLFNNGLPRHGLLSSTGLFPPLINEIPLPEEPPKWLHPQLYPNPATSQLTLDLSYDIRWMGKVITISNAQGQLMMQVQINSKQPQIDISRLSPGLYLLTAKKDDGASIKEKFIKK